MKTLAQAVQIQGVGNDSLELLLKLLEQSGLYTSSVTVHGSSYWLASLDGLGVGCIGLEHGQDASLLRSAAVLPEFRSSGVGRALTLHALEQARLRGDRAVYLFSTDAGAYWQRFGFVEIPVLALAQALPDSSQVQSGQRLGWLERDQGWMKTLEPQEV